MIRIVIEPLLAVRASVLKCTAMVKFRDSKKNPKNFVIPITVVFFFHTHSYLVENHITNSEY